MKKEKQGTLKMKPDPRPDLPTKECLQREAKQHLDRVVGRIEDFGHPVPIDPMLDCCKNEVPF